MVKNRIEVISPARCFCIVWSRWYWILSMLLLWLLAAGLYLRYTVPMYSAYVYIRLDDNQNQLSNLTGIISAKGYTNRLQSESILLKSRNILMNALNHIDWQVSYFTEQAGIKTELYPEKPFKLVILKQETDFYSNEVQVEYINTRYYKITYGNSGTRFNKLCQWDSAISLPGIQFSIAYPGKASITKCSFKFNTKAERYLRMRNGLSVNESGKFSSIAIISKKDINPVFAADALNAISDEYLRNDMRQKALSAGRIIAFIDKQLISFSAGTSASGKTVEAFKKTNWIYDIDLLAGALSEQIYQTKNKIDAVSVKLEAIKLAEEAITSRIIPAFSSAQSLGDPALDRILNRINLLYSEKAQLLTRFHTKSEPVRSIQSTIDELCSEACNMISIIKNQAVFQRNFYLKDMEEARATMQSLPEKKRQLETLMGVYSTDQKMLNFLSEKRLEAQVGQTSILPGASLIEAAVPDYTPVFPSGIVVWRSAITLGLLSGIGLILLKRSLNQLIRGKETLEKYSDVPILGIIPEFSDPDKEVGKSESLKKLKNDLCFFTDKGNCRILCITSEMRGEGKSFLSRYLADALSLTGKKIILLSSEVCKTVDQNLTMLLEELREQYDLVLIETDPVSLSANAIPFILHSDMILFVLRSGVSRFSAARLPGDLMQKYSVKNCMLILNGDTNDQLYSSPYDSL